MDKKNILGWLILALLFVIGLHLFGKYRLSSTPSFILTKLDQLMDSKNLMDSIGGSDYFEYTFNKNDYKTRDTVRYSIKIVGTRKSLLYTAIHVKKNDARNEWRKVDENLTIQ